nr:hypothetical protein BaRGS_019289 [Batillaria attramentaria]
MKHVMIQLLLNGKKIKIKLERNEGVIQMHNETFIIQPLIGGDEGHDLGIDSDVPKVLRIGLVLDKFMYMGLNFSQQLVTRYAMEIANIVDLYYRDLGFHIALSYLEYWDIADRFIVSTQQRELLEKFQKYKTSSLPADAFDVAFFLTGKTLDDNSIGMAIPDSVCSEKAIGIVKSQFSQMCGNSIVERGEECDCGSEEVLDSSHMCRERQSECDIPEYCDGETGNCPFNTYIEDGHPCASGSGYCMGGICPTLDQQCVGIWGTGAEGGSQQCYQRFNPTGNFNGHCGKDRNTGNYAKCEQENILCGLLHCAGGLNEPLYGSDKGFSKTTVSANGVEYQCKWVCTPDDICFCDVGWTGEDCGEEVNMTTPAPAPPVALTTDSEPTPLVKVVPIPLDGAMEDQTTPLSDAVEAAPVSENFNVVIFSESTNSRGTKLGMLID